MPPGIPAVIAVTWQSIPASTCC